MSRTLTRRPARVRVTDRILLRESATAPPLKVDRDAGVIYGVRVLGRYSPNNRKGSTEGTEYPPETQRTALPLLEGVTVKIDHPFDRTRPSASRSCDETFGVLRNVRPDGDTTRADLHYYKSHAMADVVCEDVERALGQFGLSINAAAAGTVVNGVYVVEEIGAVNSVDLVDKPATNLNLWESLEPAVTHTAKSILESQRKRFARSPNKTAWVDRLLEDDMAGPMAAAVEEPAADPDEVLAQGFDAACSAVLAGDGTADDKAKKIKELLKAQEKLATKGEPDAPAKESDDAPDDKPDDEGKPKMESLEREAAVNKLCRTEKYIPSETVFESLVALPDDAKRKALIQEVRAAGATVTPGVSDKPRSRLAGGNVTESQDDYANDSWGRATRVPAASKN